MGLLATRQTTGRAAPRRPIGLPATVRLGGAPYDVLVRDLSASGFSASMPVAARLGETVTLGLPSLGVVEAVVTRQEGLTHGFSFVRHLTSDDVQRVQCVDTVHAGAFGATVATNWAEPVIEKWPGVVRVGLILAGALGSWAAFSGAVLAVRSVI